MSQDQQGKTPRWLNFALAFAILIFIAYSLITGAYHLSLNDWGGKATPMEVSSFWGKFLLTLLLLFGVVNFLSEAIKPSKLISSKFFTPMLASFSVLLLIFYFVPKS